MSGKSFSKTENAKKGKGLYVSVGHGAYIARFLEVGTKAHEIPQRKRGIILEVSGIRGTKALSKSWNKHKAEISNIVDDVINKEISGGD